MQGGQNQITLAASLMRARGCGEETRPQRLFWLTQSECCACDSNPWVLTGGRFVDVVSRTGHDDSDGSPVRCLAAGCPDIRLMLPRPSGPGAAARVRRAGLLSRRMQPAPMPATNRTGNWAARRVSINTLASIYSQESQYKVIKTHHIHKANMGAYCAR